MSERALTAVLAARPRAAAASDAGRIRSNNEDRLYVDLERGLFMVADGVGGHAAGEVAASMAIDIIVGRLEHRSGPPDAQLRDAITLANNAVYRRAQRSVEYAGMTCVVTAALLDGGRLTIGHVGDTRLYKISRAGIVKLTHDHSPVGEQEDAREISEAEAMRHPRRNEVFRDVGSAIHAPDDPDFIEIVRTGFEPDTAILICSDGLSDMIPAAAIERIVHTHAGDPDAVVRALVGAANDAGGRDNVSVVYAEGAGFSRARWRSDILAAPRRWPGPRPDAGARGSDADPDARATSTSRTAGAVRAVIRSRATWLAVGALAGMAAGLASLLVLDGIPLWRGRVLVAGGAESGYPSIGAAMAVALARDIVEVEPGEYAEPVVVKSGVELVARVPGSVVLVAPPGGQEWTSLRVSGPGSAVRGIQVLGRPEAPVTTGMRVEGDGVVIDDTTVVGTVGVGIDVRHGGGVVIRSSRFLDMRGLPIRVGPSARPLLRQNLFVRGTGDDGPAVLVEAGGWPALLANMFVGYADPVGAPAPQRELLLRGNYRGVAETVDGSRQ